MVAALFLCLLLFFANSSSLFAFSSQEQVTIGVLAKRGVDKALEKWDSTAKYLTESIPSCQFTIIPLTFKEVHQSVLNGSIDFLITNSAYYVSLEGNHGLSRIATLRNHWHHNGYQIFGGVIFTRADNPSINKFSELENKVFMAVDPDSFGGWLMALFEFHKNGILPERDFKSLDFAGTHDKVVFAVRDKIADAGTVRTDTLERMAVEGKIDLKDFKIIGSQPKSHGFPFFRSTALYPEWPFAKLPHTSNDLAEQVTIALLNMPSQSPAAVASKITGWTVPLDYRPVHQLMKELKIGRYHNLDNFGLIDIARKYLAWIIASLLLISAIVFTSLYVAILNKKLRSTRSELKVINKELEHRVEERTVDLQKEIVEHKETETLLLDSEKKYRSMMESMIEPVYICSSDYRIEYLNPAMIKRIGRDATDENCFKAMHNFNKECPWCKYNISINDKPIESEIVSPLDKRSYHIIHTPIVRSNGSISKMSVWRDITELKSALKSAQQAEKSFRNLFESISDLIYTTDLDGRFTSTNPAMQKLFGYNEDEFMGRESTDFMKPELRSYHGSEYLKTLKSQGFYEGISSYFKRDGSKLYIDYRSTLVETRDGAPYISGMGKDVTDKILSKRKLKKLEEQIIQSQKMETIGTLAGGIAHDFNNILFPIIGYTEMLLADLPEDSPQRKSLEGIYNGAMRASELVKQILTFSRQDSNEVRLIKVQPIIREVLKLIRSTIPATISIDQDIQTDPIIIKADPTQIHQVVMNLATNAYHAMEDTGGVLKVDLQQIELAEQDVPDPEMQPGIFACLTIADTGMGIDSKVREKIFDPFFTTKELGKGTRMGLSVVHGIVKNAGGGIKVHSQPGKGTEFHVYLPVTKGTSVQYKSSIKKFITGGTERILLVDDEEAIVLMEKQMLERLGYQVVSRTSSLEALEAFRANPDKFNVVISDMAMPNMSGEQLAFELIKIRPDIPIVLCTGFSERLPEEKAKSMGIKCFLMKPIAMKDFSQNIREVLDDAKGMAQE